MRLSLLLNKTRNGETLTDKEIDILAKKLNVTDSVFVISYKVILSVIVWLFLV